MSVMSFEALDQLAEMQDQYPSADQLDPNVIASLREKITGRITSLPVYEQYIRHLDGPGSPRNRFGWHAEGERLYAAMLMAAAGLPRGPRVLTADGGEDPPYMGTSLSITALMAQVYLWSSEIEDLAVATPLPKHVVSRDAMPFPVMFWSREVAHFVGEYETNWMLVLHSVQGIRVVVDLVNTRDRTWDIMMGDVPYGATFPDDFPEGPNRLGATSVLSRLAFLASPYIAPDTERVPRAWRREAQRAGVSEAIADPLVRVVKLRREAQENVRREREDRAAAATERRSHWWVSGHHRAQWYPSKQAHEVIWIAPYLKGDVSKPLASKVYAVVR